MKHLLLLASLLLLSSFLIHSQVEQAFLRKGCDELYAEDVQKILTQFTKIATEQQLKEYKEFMLAIKLRSDLQFKLTPFEYAIIDDIRAVLRTPLTNYTACRSQVGVAFAYDFQTINPSKRVLTPCETTFAAQMQDVLDSLRFRVSSDMLEKSKNFMMLLKYYEDLGFLLAEFERKTHYATRARLREPWAKYNTCRDSLVRIKSNRFPQ